MRVAEFAGDFLYCCGDDLGPRGENAACACDTENGVETGGVAAGMPEGVRPWLWFGWPGRPGCPGGPWGFLIGFVGVSMLLKDE